MSSGFSVVRAGTVLTLSAEQRAALETIGRRLSLMSGRENVDLFRRGIPYRVLKTPVVPALLEMLIGRSYFEAVVKNPFAFFLELQVSHQPLLGTVVPFRRTQAIAVAVLGARVRSCCPLITVAEAVAVAVGLAWVGLARVEQAVAVRVLQPDHEVTRKNLNRTAACA